MGTLEATNHLYGHHAYDSSVAQYFLPTNVPEERDRLLKTKEQIEEIEKNITDKNKNDPNMSVFLDNFIDVYYPQRPRKLEKISLFNMFSNFK